MPHALVAGGSLGGLLAANLLRSIGWTVDVFERVGDDLASRGAGIGTHEELLEIMHRIGVTVDASIGVHPQSRTCLDRSGAIQHHGARGRGERREVTGLSSRYVNSRSGQAHAAHR